MNVFSVVIIMLWHTGCFWRYVSRLLSIVVLGTVYSACALNAQWTITTIELIEYNFQRKTAFTTAKGTSENCPGIFVLITAQHHDKRTLTGLGDILPRALVTNEIMADAWEGARVFREHLLGRQFSGQSPGADGETVRALLAELSELAAKHPLKTSRPPAPHRQLRATLCGFDIGLLDLVGQIHNVPVCRILSENPRDVVEISATTFNADTPTERIKGALERLGEDSARAVRIKIGADDERDLEVIRQLARNFARASEPREIFVDVNQAWKTAERSIEMLEKIRLILLRENYRGRFICEQPTLETDWAALAAVNAKAAEWNRLGAPQFLIMADEILWDSSDVEHLLSHQAAGAVNIKIQKAGGLLESMNMARLLSEKAPHVEIYVGGLIMTDVGAYANLQLALALPRLDYLTGSVPRGGAFFVQPATNPLRYTKGRMLSVPSRPGLGTGLDRDAIATAIRRVCSGGEHSTDHSTNSQPYLSCKGSL